jgi:protein arginine N-methyltransferase 1
MYDLCAYGEMIGDSPRSRAYVDALTRVVTPGCTVLDLGAGPCYWALLAARLGARKVYAIEPDPAVEVGRRLAAKNYLDGVIEIHRKTAAEVELPEAVDVIVSDLHGALPFFGEHLDVIADARTRFLKPGGVLLPYRDKLWLALTEAPEQYDRMTKPWEQRMDLDLTLAREMVLNTWRRHYRERANLLSAPVCWGSVEYAAVTDPSLTAEITVRAGREGRAHGLCVWFDGEVLPGIGYSNAPGEPELPYGMAFFPWLRPIDFVEDELARIRIDARLVGGEYVWRWETQVPGKAHFRQTTFQGSPLSKDLLQKSSAVYRPVLDEEGEVVRFTLEQMRGECASEEIAAALQARWPARFRSSQAALALVGRLAVRYSK